jgi:competence protein ComEC
VGQGDSIYIETAGGYSILVDGGPNNKVLQYLGEDLPFYNRKIDLLILTHPQSDHMNGLIEVVKRYQINTLWISDSENKTEAFEEWQDLINSKKLNTKVVSKGDQLKLPDGTVLKVLWPERDHISFDLNQLSIVFLLSFGNFDALLTGDADHAVQPFGLQGVDLEVLKVPHHGSRLAIKQEFLEQVSPEISVISVGARNSYGHPNPELIKRIIDINSEVFRTDQNGTVEIVSDGMSWYTKTQR